MAGKNTAVFGIYQDRATVESAVTMLQQSGFRNTDISVLFPYNEGTKDFAAEKNTKAPEGTAAGGPIMAALAGVGVGGAIGGITGALIGMGIPEYEAKRYEGRIKEGGILLSVHSDNSDWTRKAKEILERSGAQDVSSAGEAGADFSKSDRPMPRAS
jgi:hypothetical protein